MCKVTSTLVTDEIEDYHVTRLREFRYDERYVDPRDIALRDRDEFYVEKILAHHGDVGRLKTLAFMLNGGALMNLLTLRNRGKICVRPKCFIVT